jgi:hypothetical protein
VTANERNEVLGYPPLLHTLASRLRNAASADSSPEALAAGIEALLPTQGRCVLCTVRAKAETEVISKLADRLTVDETQAMNSLSAICIPHFSMLAAAIPDAALVRKLMAQQATILERLSEDMERYALKHDAVRRFLETREEATAAERALLVLAGHRNVNAA